MQSSRLSGGYSAACLLSAPGWLALGVVAGTALQLGQVDLWAAPVYAGLLAGSALALVVVSACRQRFAARGMRDALLALSACALAFALAGARAIDRQADRLDAALWGQTVSLTGVVDSLPVRGNQGLRFVLSVESAFWQGAPVRVPRRVQLGLWRSGADAAEVDVHVGERWQLEARLRPVHGLSNPHGGDRELHAWAQGIGAQGSVRPGARRLAVTDSHPLERWREAMSLQLQGLWQDGGHGGVLAALAVGDQDAIPADDWQLFRRTGVAHLMAISGLHITLFAWLAIGLLGRLWRALGRWQPSWLLAWPAVRVAAVGGWCAAAAYALAAGWGVPARRTVLMLGLGLWLRAGARHWPWPVQWLVVLGAVLMTEPWAWLQPGFWLSFVAVGVLMAADSGRPVGSGRAGRAVLGLLREQVVVTLALAPLSLWLFGETSVIGLLANLVAIPWVSLVVTPLTLAGMVMTPLWDLAAWAFDPLARLLRVLSTVDHAVWTRPAWPWPHAVAGLAGGVLAVLPWPALLRAGGALVLAWVLCWSPEPPAPGHFRLWALDVGQGSAVLVQTRSHAVLHDTGPAWGTAGDAGGRVVVPTLRALGVVPDRVMVSHRDSDHAGGSAAVRQAYPLALWSSSEPVLATERCWRGQRWSWDGVQFEVLSPEPDDYSPAGQGRLPSNAMSCVLRLQAVDGTSAVLTGDVDAPRETRMVMARPDQRTDLLLAPHHGSRSSSSPVLLNAWQPARVLVQSGFMNRFGHPAPEVLSRYRERGMQVSDSPSCGAATWDSRTPQQVVCERERRRRHWHVPVPPALPP